MALPAQQAGMMVGRSSLKASGEEMQHFTSKLLPNLHLLLGNLPVRTAAERSQGYFSPAEEHRWTRTWVLIMWCWSHISNLGQAWSQTDTPRSWEHAPHLDCSSASPDSGHQNHSRTHLTSLGPGSKCSSLSSRRWNVSLEQVQVDQQDHEVPGPVSV